MPTSRERYKALRTKIFGAKVDVWNGSRKGKDKHFTSIPRVMPLILRYMDEKAGTGTPVSRTYLALWCRHWETGFILNKGEEDLAFEAGFSGQRARNTWRRRMKLLIDLGFISVKKGPTGPFHYILLKHPISAAEDLHKKEGDSEDETFNALAAKLIEQGIPIEEEEE